MARRADVSAVYLDLPAVRPEAQLLRADGSEYRGGTVVKQLHVPHMRSFPQVVEYQDNSRGFSELGDEQGRIDSMTVECFHWLAVRQIKDDLARERTGGLFRLEIPHASKLGVHERHLIRFFEVQFAPQSRRLPGGVRVHSATVSDIEVMGRV